MKLTRFTAMLCTTFTALCLNSCGGSDGTRDSAEVVAVQSNIINTAEYVMNIRHKVANYAKWKPVYEAHESARLAKGIHNYVIARGTKDSNIVMLALKIDDVTQAQAFANDPNLKEAMAKGGVSGKPSITFLEMVYQDTTPLPPNITRTQIKLKVKEWDRWRKAFESHRQVRTDNGLTDRVYGHDVDDSHNVVIVMAVDDSAKADAFWKSEQVKQLRAESGVVGEPEMFSFRVVQRY